MKIVVIWQGIKNVNLAFLLSHLFLLLNWFLISNTGKYVVQGEADKGRRGEITGGVCT